MNKEIRISYSQNAFDAVVEMVSRFNPNKFSKWTIEESLRRSIELLLDPNTRFTSTMGYMVISVDQDEIDGVIVRYIDFMFCADTYHVGNNGYGCADKTVTIQQHNK